MANLTNYDRPERGSLSPAGNLDDLLRGFFVRPMSWPAEGAPQVPLKIEVSETESGYRVVAEIPGARKEDINVSIDGNQVQITAEVKRENETSERGNGGSRILHSERYYGKVSRVLSVGCEIDEASAQAKYENGMLELTLPKSPSDTPRKINVQ